MSLELDQIGRGDNIPFDGDINEKLLGVLQAKYPYLTGDQILGLIGSERQAFRDNGSMTNFFDTFTQRSLRDLNSSMKPAEVAPAKIPLPAESLAHPTNGGNIFSRITQRIRPR